MAALAAACPAIAAAQPGAARVCAHANVGFYERDASGGLRGLEADLLKGFAASTKANLTFDDLASFDLVLSGTEAGECQIGAATVSVTEARKSRFRYSTPYFPNRIVVVQKTSSHFINPASLKGQRVAVVKGTVSTGLIAAIPEVKTVTVNDDAAAFAALVKGDADALACDSAVVLDFLTRHPDLGMAFPLGERSFFAFILPKDSKIAPALDAYLTRTVRSGEFKKMLATYFGEGNADFLASEVVPASR